MRLLSRTHSPVGEDEKHTSNVTGETASTTSLRNGSAAHCALSPVSMTS
jgi:hypothetical protein